MKNPVLLCLGLLAASCSLAQVYGPNSSSTFTNVPISGSSHSWLNVNNANISDDTYASFQNLPGGNGLAGYTDYLEATNFGFNVPAGAKINGILAEVERSDPNSKTSDYSIRIVKNGVIGAGERSTAASYPATDTYKAYGNSGDLWGESWSSADINNSGFGIAIAAQRGVAGGTTAGQVDHIRITVFYNFLILPVKITGFSLQKTGKEVQLNWYTNEESNLDHYEIQRSSNGIDFTPLGTLASHNLTVSDHYSYEDQNPLQGIAYYRLNAVSNSATNSYSRIISVQFSTGNMISLYPNPWQKGSDLFVTNPNHELLSIRFFTASGQLTTTVTTSSDMIPANQLAGITGISWYKIYNSDNSERSSGILLNR